jgi:hypothetical protein
MDLDVVDNVVRHGEYMTMPGEEQCDCGSVQKAVEYAREQGLVSTVRCTVKVKVDEKGGGRSDSDNDGGRWTGPAARILMSDYNSELDSGAQGREE